MPDREPIAIIYTLAGEPIELRFTFDDVTGNTHVTMRPPRGDVFAGSPNGRGVKVSGDARPIAQLLGELTTLSIRPDGPIEVRRRDA